MRGGEKVPEALADLYPDADIFTLLIKRSHFEQAESTPRSGSFLQKKPGAVRHYHSLLP
jgi:hypothetical protein